MYSRIASTVFQNGAQLWSASNIRYVCLCKSQNQFNENKMIPRIRMSCQIRYKWAIHSRDSSPIVGIDMFNAIWEQEKRVHKKHLCLSIIWVPPLVLSQSTIHHQKNMGQTLLDTLYRDLSSQNAHEGSTKNPSFFTGCISTSQKQTMAVVQDRLDVVSRQTTDPLNPVSRLSERLLSDFASSRPVQSMYPGTEMRPETFWGLINRGNVLWMLGRWL